MKSLSKSKYSIFLLLLGCLLMGFLFLYQKVKEPPPLVMQTSGLASSGDAKTKTLPAEVPSKPAVNSAEYGKIKEYQAADLESSTLKNQFFFERPLSSFYGEVMLPFSLSWKMGCGYADGVVLNRLSRAEQVRRLLVSIEKLSREADFPPLTSIAISTDRVLKGTQIALPLPDVDSMGVYGFYICTDMSGTKSCKHKPAFDYAFSSKAKTFGGDRVLYFAPIILSQGAMYTLDYARGAQAYEALREYLLKLWSEDVVDDILRYIKRMNSALLPFQLIISSPTISLVLPVRHKYCEN